MAGILLIDDDKSIRNVLRMVLEKAGHDVMEAADGLAGLKLAKTRTFDLLIIDMLMPELDGMETIRRLRKVSQRIKILAMSSGGTTLPEIFLSVALQAGADGALMKPCERDEFLREVERLLNRK